MVGRTTEDNVFQKRLNELFSNSKQRLTNKIVVEGMLDQGIKISSPYLSQLRNGVRNNPSDDVVEALARYFGVPSGYFFTTPWRRHRNRLAAQSHDAKIINSIADPAMKTILASANGLSPSSLEVLSALATKFRAADKVRLSPPDSPWNSFD